MDPAHTGGSVWALCALFAVVPQALYFRLLHSPMLLCAPLAAATFACSLLLVALELRRQREPPPAVRRGWAAASGCVSLLGGLCVGRALSCVGAVAPNAFGSLTSVLLLAVGLPLPDILMDALDWWFPPTAALEELLIIDSA